MTATKNVSYVQIRSGAEYDALLWDTCCAEHRPSWVVRISVDSPTVMLLERWQVLRPHQLIV